MNKKLLQRFGELAEQATQIAQTERTRHSEYGSYQHLDDEAFLGWTVKVRNLLVNACGPKAVHVAAFAEAEELRSFDTSPEKLKRCRGVFAAAREDYEGGYLTSIEELVRAEVFDDELEQASVLLKAGFFPAGAVVAGVVLETALRGLCAKHSIESGKMERMNADLVKAGVYTVLVQKQVTEMAHVRNKAAHGEVAEYTEADVRKMVGNVGDFVAAHVVA